MFIKILSFFKKISIKSAFKISYIIFFKKILLFLKNITTFNKIFISYSITIIYGVYFKEKMTLLVIKLFGVSHFGH